uniref:Peptidase_M1 domain-containing protein n=1 Tax=Rhabditophanes sp. KR3021 TaxID=114890 RepID=A0AC35UHB4_9BILA
MDEAKATDEPIRKNDSGFSFSSTKKYDDYPASLFRQSKTPVDGVKFDTNGEDDDFENIKLDSKPSSSHDIADARVKSPTNDMGRHGSYHPNKLAKSGSKAKIHVTPNNTSVTHHSSSPSKKNEQRNGASKCAIIGLIILGILAALLAALLSHMVTKNNCPIGFPNHTLVLDDRFGPDFFKNTTVVDEEEEKFLKIDGPTAEELKLPTNLKPDWYDLKIKTYLPGFVEISEEKNLTFDGDLSIKFHVIKETKEIVLNADQLTFDLDVENYKLLKVVPSKKDEGRFKREATTPETHHTTQEIQTTTSGSVATTILIDTTTEIDNNVQTDQINAATIALEETTALPSTQSVISTTEENVHNILETSKTDQLKHTTLSLPHETVEENIILEETVDSGIKFVKIAVNETLKKVVFHLSDILKQGDQYILVLKYKGIINNHLSGLYATKYTSNHKTQFAAISQMEPADARQMVVCFDEPSFKAKWRVSIIHPAGSRAISNGMEVKDGVDTEDKNWKLTTFKETLPMSSYLLTVVICNFTFIEGFTKTGIRFRVWSRPEAIHQTKYALETGIKVIEFYEEYFDEPFPMSKICMVAIPDFRIPNEFYFRLITYRETEILYDPKVQYPFQKMRVATVIAHECAHQWFGDLTTMYDFQSLWLNEGFASFLEFIGTDAVSDNAFRQDEYFVISALDYAMEADAKATSHPLNFPIEKAEDALQVFGKF